MTRVQNKCKKTKYKYSENKVKKTTRGQNPQTLPPPLPRGRRGGTQHGSHAGVFGTRPAGSHGRICNDNRKESGCHPGAGAVTHRYITSGTWPLAPRIEDRGGGAMHAELMGSADPGTSRDPVYLSGGYIHTVFSCILGVTAVCPAGVKPLHIRTQAPAGHIYFHLSVQISESRHQPHGAAS